MSRAPRTSAGAFAAIATPDFKTDRDALELRTDRLVLKPTFASHAGDLFEAVQHSITELRPWMAWAEEPSLEATLQFATEVENQWVANAGWNFTVFLEGSVAGAIGLHHYDALHSTAQVGYWLRSDVCGQGLATEALRAVVRFGFDQRELHRLELRVAPGNAPSIRVAEKAGFQYEGVLGGAGRAQGRFHDLLAYGQLRTD